MLTSWLLNPTLYQKEPGLPGEMVDCSVGVGEMTVNQEHLVALEIRMCSKNNGDVSTGH